MPESAATMEGWTLTTDAATVQVKCQFCGYTFVRWLNETVGNVMATAAQHEC